MKRVFTEPYLTVAAVAVIAAAIFAINVLTPFLADDYANLPVTIWGTNEPLTDLGGWIRSIQNFYMQWGGRVEGSVLVAFLLSLPPMAADLLNTLCYLLVVLFIDRICKRNDRHSLPFYLGIHALLWICVPDYGQVMFWICGAANYLYPSVIVLSLLYLYHRYSLSDGTLFSGRIVGGLTFLHGFLAGFAMENMSAGMLVILTLLMVSFYRRHQTIQFPVIAAYIGSLAGFACLVLAPGNRARADAEIKVSVFFKFFIICYYWVFFAGLLTVLWLVLYRLVKKNPHAYDPAAVFEAVCYLCGAAAAAFCMLAAPTSPERTWYIVCVYAVIAAGILYRLLEPHQRPAAQSAVHIVSAGMMVFLLVSMADTCICSYEITAQTREREAYILEQKALGNFTVRTPVIAHRYPFRAKHDALTGLSDITDDPAYWINQAVAAYYGVDSILGISP